MICSANPAALDIALFGGLCLRHGRDQVLDLPGRKDRALLGFLAASPGVHMSRERLAALLWGDSSERQARDSLKQALLRLRRAFGPSLATALVANRLSVMLAPEWVTVDVATFERLLGDGSADALEQAIALYRGDLLEGVHVREAGYEDWLGAERQRLRGLATEAVVSLMEQSLAGGRRDRAAGAARRLLCLDPLHESACRTLMRHHADRGEKAQALKLFATLRDRLREELSVAPEAGTLQLYEALRDRRAWDRCEEPMPDAARRHACRPEPRPKPAVAVLSFDTIGDDAEQQYFSDGLTEDIAIELSRISGLFVASRPSTLAFSSKQVQQAARALNVGHVLVGSVRKSADRVRVNAQLVDGATGGHLWAQRYDRCLDDIFALQDEITESIVAALKVKLLPEEVPSLARHATTNVEAYEYYLMGRSFYLRGLDRHSLRIARDMFAKAIEIDPRYARAHAAVAICESYLAMGNPHATYESFFAHSQRALELDPNLAEAYTLKGLALYAEGRYADAETEFNHALQLDPDLFETHFFYGRNCRLQGRHEEAARLFERAAGLRDNDYRALGLLAKSYKAMGRRNNLLAAARACLERVEAEAERHPDNAGALAFGSAVLAELGEPKRAEEWAARAVMIGPEDCVVRYSVARTRSILGDPEAALDCLEVAFGSSAIWQRRLALWMKADEDIMPLWRHPRCRILLQRLETRLGIVLLNHKRRRRTVADCWGGSGSSVKQQGKQIRISAQPAFAARWLIHRLDHFRKAWPDCEVVLDATPRLVDLQREDTDIAIRRGPGECSGVARELLVRSRVYPVASPTLLPHHSAVLLPRDLRDLVLLHDDDGSLWRSWFAAAGVADIETGRGPRILDSGLAIEAAIAGQGVALADLFLVADDLASGRLAKLCDHAIPDWDYYLVSPSNRRQHQSIIAFRDWLMRATEALREEGRRI